MAGIVEFKAAMADLNQVMRAAEKHARDTCRPAIAAGFQVFFETYPEIQSISFKIATDVYDDENYREEIAELHYLVDPALLDEDVEQDIWNGFDYGALAEPSDYVLRRARGELSHGEERLPRDRRDAIIAENAKEVATYQELVDRIGKKRIVKLRKELERIGSELEAMDIDFAKIVFGADKTVTATKAGLKIAK